MMSSVFMYSSILAGLVFCFFFSIDNESRFTNRLTLICDDNRFLRIKNNLHRLFIYFLECDFRNNVNFTF